MWFSKNKPEVIEIKNSDTIGRFIAYCRKQKIKEIGLAYCEYFKKDAKVVHDQLRPHFTVRLACCKTCSNNHKQFKALYSTNNSSLPSACLGDKSLFNILNNTGVNLVLGLCPEQNAEFFKNSKSLSAQIIVHRPPTHHAQAPSEQGGLKHEASPSILLQGTG